MEQRAAWAIAGDDVLGFSHVIAGDQHDVSNGVPADVGDVVLQEAVLAVGTGELVRLLVVQ